jgi:hypothetical protein
MNDISPFTVKSRDTFQLSESKEGCDERANQTHSRKSSNDLENIDPYKHKTQISPSIAMNSDLLVQQCDYQPEHKGIKEYKVTNSDGTIRFVATEVVSGKIKKDLCHQGHVSEHCSSELSDSINQYDDVMGASIENSVENSAFIRNLMLRRELSPNHEDGTDNEIDNEPSHPHIHVGTLSEESEDHFTENSHRRSEMDDHYRNMHGDSDDSNLQITDPDQENLIDQSSGDHIRVEHNSEEEEQEEHIRYPPLQEIQEDPDCETEGHSSMRRHLEDSKITISPHKESMSESQPESSHNRAILSVRVQTK